MTYNKNSPFNYKCSNNDHYWYFIFKAQVFIPNLHSRQNKTSQILRIRFPSERPQYKSIAMNWMLKLLRDEEVPHSEERK